MSKRIAFPASWFLIIFVVVGVGYLLRGLSSSLSQKTDPETWVAVRSDFEEWIPLSGRLEAENPISFRVELDGLSKLTYLAEDGIPVVEGDVIARFDASDLEERKRTLLRDRDIAQAKLRSLRDAEHPLHLQRLEQEIVAIEAEIRKEALLTSETESLVEEGLLAEEELELYKENISALQSRKDALEQQRMLTKNILHPTEVQIATARKTAAEAGLKKVNRSLDSTVIRAPTSGIVHLPLIPIDGERRPARVGDGLFRNQVYLQVANLTELIIRTNVGERLLAKVVPGMEALIRFPAFPERTERAMISEVGAYPRGSERRYPVELKWQTPPSDLRPGLTATIQVLSSKEENGIVVPRDFVEWQGTSLLIHTSTGTKEVQAGPGNASGILIRSGIEEGDRLVRP